MEGEKLLEDKRECCNKNNTQNLILVSFFVLLLSVGLTQGIQAYQERNIIKECIAWGGFGISYWGEECKYHHINNESCTWSVDDKNTDEFISKTYDANKTLINESHIPCTKKILVEYPLEVESVNKLR